MPFGRNFKIVLQGVTRIRCRRLAPDKVRLEWPLAKDQRAHIHQIIDGWDLPVTHTTRRTGRPFTLVLEKTAALFKRDAAERQSLREDLEWLQNTSSEF